MSAFRSMSIIATYVALLTTPAWSGHTLTSNQERVLAAWLTSNVEYRIATDADCDCAEDIQRMKVGYGGNWGPVPDYRPYTATGDFNGDGVVDFAVVVINRSSTIHNFALLVFNGPLGAKVASPAFVKPGLDLKGQGLFYGPPRPKPYRLLVGPFEAEGAVLSPYGRTYKLIDH